MTAQRRPGAAWIVPLLAAVLVGGHVNAQSQPPDGSAALDPACDVAFQVAADVAARSAAGPASPPAVVLAAPGSVPIDVAIRACASLTDWAAGAARYPEALAGGDALQLLVERCVDPAAGLAAFQVCAAIAEAPASAAPAASPASSPSPAASPGPASSPSPAPVPSQAPSPAASPSPSTAPPDDEGSRPRLVRLPRFDTRVRGADRVSTFPILGDSPESLLRAMQEGAARVCPQHASACTLTQPRIRPRVLRNAQTGSCRVVGLQASADDTVHIPRWSGPRRVVPELVAWWREVYAHVRWHEAQHIKISQRHLASLRKRIVGKSCQRISLEVQRMSQKLGQEQAAFDMRDQGWLPPYDGPLP